MKHWGVVIAIIVVLLLGYIFILSKGSINQTDNSPVSTNPDAMTYFWSETCPHCKNVADFLASWPNGDKIILDKKEVSKDRNNAALFTKKGTECKIPEQEMGVPLLITKEGQCLTGDTPIIEYFKNLFPESTPSATVSATPKR